MSFKRLPRSVHFKTGFGLIRLSPGSVLYLEEGHLELHTRLFLSIRSFIYYSTNLGSDINNVVRLTGVDSI